MKSRKDTIFFGKVITISICHEFCEFIFNVCFMKTAMVFTLMGKLMAYVLFKIVTRRSSHFPTEKPDLTHSYELSLLVGIMIITNMYKWFRSLNDFAQI